MQLNLRKISPEVAAETARAAAYAAYFNTLRRNAGLSIPQVLYSEQRKTCAETKGTCVIATPQTLDSIPPTYP